MTYVIIFIIIVIAIIFINGKCRLKCQSSETFGQDASIRVSSGWIAGPKGLYGYDPIDKFAEQITAMRRSKSHEYYKERHPPYIIGKPCSTNKDCDMGENCDIGTCLSY